MNRETIEIAQKNFERKKKNQKLYESLQFLHDAELEEAREEFDEEDDLMMETYTQFDLIMNYLLGFATGGLLTATIMYLSMCV